MSASDDGSSSPRSQLSSQVFGDLLDSIIVDVASECHRIARLGLDRNLEEEEEEFRLSAQARVADPSSSSDGNSKSMVDIFGQTHPAIASEIFDCMNCGRPIVAGRFAPHLEKCMGKVGSFCFSCHWISMNVRDEEHGKRPREARQWRRAGVPVAVRYQSTLHTLVPAASPESQMVVIVLLRSTRTSHSASHEMPTKVLFHNFVTP